MGLRSWEVSSLELIQVQEKVEGIPLASGLRGMGGATMRLKGPQQHSVGGQGTKWGMCRGMAALNSFRHSTQCDSTREGWGECSPPYPAGLAAGSGLDDLGSNPGSEAFSLTLDK